MHVAAIHEDIFWNFHTSDKAHTLKETQATKYFVILLQSRPITARFALPARNPKKERRPAHPAADPRARRVHRRNMWKKKKLCTCCYDLTDHVDVRGDGLQLCGVCASHGGEYGILRFPAMENDCPAARDLRTKMISFMVGNPGDYVEERNVLGSALVVVSIRYSKDAEAVTSWLKLTKSFQDSSPVLQMLHESIMETAKCIGEFEERFNCTIPTLEFGKSYPPLFFSRLEACGYRHMYAFSFRTGVMHNFQVEIELRLKKNDGAALQEFAQHGDHHYQSGYRWAASTMVQEPIVGGLDSALAPLSQGEAQGNARQFMIDYDFVNLKNCEDIGHAEDIVAEEARRKVAAQEVRRNGEVQNTLGSLDD